MANRLVGIEVDIVEVPEVPSGPRGSTRCDVRTVRIPVVVTSAVTIGPFPNKTGPDTITGLMDMRESCSDGTRTKANVEVMRDGHV